MSKKPIKKSKSGEGDDPLKVNWFVIAGAVVVVGVVVFFSVQQTMQVEATATAIAKSATEGAATSTVLSLTTAAQPTASPAPGMIDPATGACIPTTKKWDSPPAMTIDKAKKYIATVKMQKGGEFKIELLADKAPITVNSFVFLAREGFYNCVTFHRVLEGFMAQGGDPTGTGGGGPGYEFQNEETGLAFDKPGVVAMANSGPNTNGSQFFVMFGPYGLDSKDYTIFGQVTEGIEVVNGITRRDPDKNPEFTGDAIESITITEK